MTADPDARCALVSRDRGEPLGGTASRVVRWVVVEQPGAWGEDAVVESRLDEKVGRTLQSAGRRHGFRPLLVRRPGWRKPDGGPRVLVARTRRNGGWIEQLTVDDPQEITRIDWSLLDSAVGPGIGEPGPAAVQLVCTNGRHDPCCADQGRPVVRALDEAGIDEIWESTHVGGDRFAANLVSLPDGVFYGRVEPEQAVRLVTELRAGLLDLDHYRGRSCFSPLAQAAEIHARRDRGERRLDGLRIVSAERRGDDALAVRFDHETGTVDVVVSRRRAEPELLTCGSTPAKPWRYVLDSIASPP